MTEPFKPADGVTPRWRKLANLVESLNPGDGISFNDAFDALGEDVSRETLQAAMREASVKLEKQGGRSVAARGNYGWVVLTAAQTIDQANRHRQKAQQQVKRGLTRIGSAQAHRNELEQADRERADREQSALNFVDAVMGKRKKSIAEIVAEASTKAIGA